MAHTKWEQKQVNAQGDSREELCFNELASLRLSGNVSQKCHIGRLNYHKDNAQKISFGVNAATLLTNLNSCRETTTTRNNKDIIGYTTHEHVFLDNRTCFPYTFSSSPACQTGQGIAVEWAVFTIKWVPAFKRKEAHYNRELMRRHAI